VEWSTTARQTETLFAWKFLGHVEPPVTVDDAPERIFYLGPNHYPAGLYMPKGYNIEQRPGDDVGWTILRVRDCLSEQVLTMWAVMDEDKDENGDYVFPGADRIRTLEGET